MDGWAVQSGSGVRFHWGPTGASRLANEAACLVAVDVLSFTTAVSVAVDRGIRVLPFRWPGGPASEAERSGAAQVTAAYARQSGARLASHRHPVTPETPWSLSPAHLRAAPFVARPVLPSPNGAAIAAAAPPGVRVVAACLRNITAVGTWLTCHGYGTPEHPVVVIAAGELSPDGSLRPALEDLLGAGAHSGSRSHSAGGYARPCRADRAPSRAGCAGSGRPRPGR
ncbi:2-phosphosulfolactate phosphatase [Streptomyces canus]|uniref:2-phosphosulfolactate phosphatase n=1 Tax=Streptomyces canus TaxID=58343 RepID=A0AAW8F7T9_9ACTN|nr:hypothetical protein [Streptomyces canus]MDQ0905210.1 2-phosphosulfolactate phosphatase [Streptomyces canus]